MITCFSALFLRLSELCKSTGSKHPTVNTPTPEEEVDVGAWPVQTGDHKGGKKGDIFKLVSEPGQPRTAVVMSA